jgi:endo-1,4-beta-xylanase
MPSRILAEMSPAKRRALVMNHIRDVVPALRDAAKAPIAVDMVNEVRVNRFFQENGDPTLVEDAFRLTHELAPDLRLFVNDYAILNNGGENRAAIAYYHKWIQMMRAKDLPLHGIGFQGHFSAGLTPPERLIEIMDGFAEYSLPLHITEFDVETLDEGAQADYTRDMVLAALSVPSVEAFIFWQFWEGDHWKPNAAMLEQNWTPKPAYHAWRDLVFGTFWTDTKIVTDALGRATIRGMRGRYEVQFGQDIRQVDLDGAETSVRF